MIDPRSCLALVARALVPLVLAIPALAAGPTLEQRLTRCVDEQNDAARLACYDRIASETSPATPAEPAVAPARSARAAAPAGTPGEVSPATAATTPAATTPATSGPAAPPGRPATAASEARPSAPSAATQQESFGLAGSELARKQVGEQGAPEVPEADRMTATVTQISKRPRGEMVFTLDNGQVWAQKSPRYFPLATGDQVTILRGALRSYRLIAGGRSTQVTRVE